MSIDVLWPTIAQASIESVWVNTWFAVGGTSKTIGLEKGGQHGTGHVGRWIGVLP